MAIIHNEEQYPYMVTNWATLACCFTNLQKASTVKFKAASFSCMHENKSLAPTIIYYYGIFQFMYEQREFI